MILYCTMKRSNFIQKNVAEHIKRSMIRIWQCLHFSERCQQSLNFWYHNSVPDLVVGVKNSLLWYKCLFSITFSWQRNNCNTFELIEIKNNWCRLSNHLFSGCPLNNIGGRYYCVYFLSLYWLTSLSPFQNELLTTASGQKARRKHPPILVASYVPTPQIPIGRTYLFSL